MQSQPGLHKLQASQNSSEEPVSKKKCKCVAFLLPLVPFMSLSCLIATSKTDTVSYKIGESGHLVSDFRENVVCLYLI